MLNNRLKHGDCADHRPPSPSPSVAPFRSAHYCNNCGKAGHSFYQCKNPITSYGIIPFRIAKNPLTGKKERQYLMIRRRDTLSYVDFMRGKYSLFNRKYIKNMIKTMTEYERTQILSQPFDVLWYELWKNNENNDVPPPASYGVSLSSSPLPSPSPSPSPPPTEKRELYSVALAMKNRKTIDFDKDPLFATSSRPSVTPSRNLDSSHSQQHTTKDKFTILQTGVFLTGKPHFSLAEIVEELEKERLADAENATETWKEPEWGFSKGRRNYRESDYDCAIREMEEETGYSGANMKIIKNINTFEEVFIGSNFKCYKHKYYLMYMAFEDSLKMGEFEKTEVSCIKWVSFGDCLSLIRSYNMEKKQMIMNIDSALNKYRLFADNI
jgi:8-oxo-dGTP pyrophosphatase MutT (NUDIX family)